MHAGCLMCLALRGVLPQETAHPCVFVTLLRDGRHLMTRVITAQSVKAEGTRSIRSTTQNRRHNMKLTRVILIALAVALPASWTVAKAEDAPPADAKPKKEKKAKKAKKGAEDAAPKDDKKM